MTCKGCERSVELAVSGIVGVLFTKAEASTGSLMVESKAEAILDKIIEKQVNQSGYEYLGLM